MGPFGFERRWRSFPNGQMEIIMISKHTPGPWRVETEYGPHPYVVRAHEGGFVVMGLSHEREIADARLIGAAPDLLHAAQAALFVLTIINEREPGTNEAGAIATLKEAILSATGEQP